jgi:DNA ligase (NAD+)
MDSKIKENIDKLQEELRYHRYQYYVLDDPIISDKEFDTLHQLFLDYQHKYPELVDSIGSPVGNFFHKHKMLSLRSTREEMDVGSFFVNYTGLISGEPKIDGLSVELIYNNGVLVAASTRGDGTIGENITSNVMLMNVPTKLREPSTCEVYGEIFLSKENFREINNKLMTSGKGQYTSLRNAAAGIIRSTETSMFIPMLNFFPYTGVGAPCSNQNEFFHWAFGNSFNTLHRLVKQLDGIDDIRDYIREMTDIRSQLPFEIDGLVFKADSFEYRSRVGEGFTHPNWAIAYKFASPSVTTRLDDVIFQVGKSGIVAPVAILKPVKLHNSMVSRASLSNKSIIDIKDIRIEDTVVVEMANDVIPYIAEVVLSDRTGKERKIEFPKVCPVCEQNLKEIGPHIVCVNVRCPNQKKGRLVAAVSRKGFNIKGLGKKLISLLVDYNIIWDISQVFLLPDVRRILREELYIGEKTLDNIFAEIEASKKIEFHKFIYALGIPDVSTATAVKIATAYDHIDNLRDDAYDGSLRPIPGISKTTHANIIEYFNTITGSDIVKDLLNNGVQIQYPSTVRSSTTRKVAITGRFDVPREEIVKQLWLKGCSMTNSISGATTNYLLCGEKPSETKVGKARKNNVPIVTSIDQIN